MNKLIAIVLLSSLLSGCVLNPLGLLSGGNDGPTVNSNAQIGKENKQAAVTFEEESNAGRDIITTETIKEVETGSVDKLKILNQNIPPWVLIVLILGWLLPTPTQMGQGLFNMIVFLFSRRSRDGTMAMDTSIQRGKS